VGYKKRGGFGAYKLSLRTKVVGRRHFHKLETSHDFLYPVIARLMSPFSFPNDYRNQLLLFRGKNVFLFYVIKQFQIYVTKLWLALANQRNQIFVRYNRILAKNSHMESGANIHIHMKKNEVRQGTKSQWQMPQHWLD
jgi:hypothetical protein